MYRLGKLFFSPPFLFFRRPQVKCASGVFGKKKKRWEESQRRSLPKPVLPFQLQLAAGSSPSLVVCFFHFTWKKEKILIASKERRLKTKVCDVFGVCVHSVKKIANTKQKSRRQIIKFVLFFSSGDDRQSRDSHSNR